MTFFSVRTDPQVDLRHLPEPVKADRLPDVVALGDLHGNCLKLIYFLLRESILQVAASAPSDWYAGWVALSEKKQWKADDVKRCDEWVQWLERTSMPPPEVILIGDDVGDRGVNDYATLKIIEKMSQLNVPFHIVFSNHSSFFLRSFLDDFKKVPEIARYGYAGLMQGRSLVELHRLFVQNPPWADREAICRLVQQYYLPHLKAIVAQSHLDPKGQGQVVLYTHAPVGFEMVQQLERATARWKTDHLMSGYQDHSPEALLQTIEDINRRVAQHWPEVVRAVVDGVPNEPVFHRLIWNRHYEDAKMLHDHPQGYALNYVHGHDGWGNVPAPWQHFVFNLDNELGKGPAAERGAYGVFVLKLPKPMETG